MMKGKYYEEKKYLFNYINISCSTSYFVFVNK